MTLILQNNIERSRKARSVQDLERITASISKSFTLNKKVVSNLSRSATRLTISMSNKSTSATNGRDAGSFKLDHSKAAIEAPKPKIGDGGSFVVDHSGLGRPSRTNLGPASAPISSKLVKFSPPKLDNVTQHTDVINAMYEKVQELDSVEAFLIQAFPEAKGQPAALKAVRALQREVGVAVQKAFGSLAQVAEASIPPEMRSIGNHLNEFLSTFLEADSYESMTETAYVFRTAASKDDPLSKATWHYTIYVTIAGLKNSAGYIFEDYNVVLSALIDKTKNAQFYLTTLSDFRIPGKFPIGRQLKSPNDLKTVLTVMLQHNDVINVLNKQAMPLTTEGARTRGFNKINGVKDSTVVDDTLILKLNKMKATTSEINGIISQILPMLKQLVKIKSNSGDIIIKPETDRGELHFQIIPTAKHGQAAPTLNLDKLKHLQFALDLSDEDIEDIKTTIKARRK